MPNICPDLDKGNRDLGTAYRSGHYESNVRIRTPPFPLPLPPSRFRQEKRWALRGGPTFLALATLLKRRFLLSRRPPRARPISRVRAELCRERNSLQISYLEECLRCRRG